MKAGAPCGAHICCRDVLLSASTHSLCVLCHVRNVCTHLSQSSLRVGVKSSRCSEWLREVNRWDRRECSGQGSRPPCINFPISLALHAYNERTCASACGSPYPCHHQNAPIIKWHPCQGRKETQGVFWPRGAQKKPEFSLPGGLLLTSQFVALFFVANAGTSLAVHEGAAAEHPDCSEYRVCY